MSKTRTAIILFAVFLALTTLTYGLYELWSNEDNIQITDDTGLYSLSLSHVAFTGKRYDNVTFVGVLSGPQPLGKLVQIYAIFSPSNMTNIANATTDATGIYECKWNASFPIGNYTFKAKVTFP